MRLPLGLGAVTGCLVLVGACGGEDDGPNAKRFDGKSKDVAAVIDDLQSAARSGEPERVCDDVFAPQLRATIERETGKSCAQRVRQQIMAKDATFKAGRVKVDGDDSAVVSVTDGNGNRSVLYLSKSDDDWRIVQIAR